MTTIHDINETPRQEAIDANESDRPSTVGVGHLDETVENTPVPEAAVPDPGKQETAPTAAEDPVEEENPIESPITEQELAVSEDFVHDFKAVIEALVFASDEPLAFRQIKDVIVGPDVPPGSDSPEEQTEPEGPVARGKKRKDATPFTINLVRRCIDTLNTEYRETGRAFRITEIAGGFAFQTTHEFGGYVGRLFAERSKRRLSQSALETLAIIAFKQPISKPAVEAIRGVNADFVLKSLLERNLVTIVGRDSTVGRPLLYGTTKFFLKHFGLKNLDELPKPREIQELLAEERERDILLIDDVDERKTAELHHIAEDGHLFDTIPVAATLPDADDEFIDGDEDSFPDAVAGLATDVSVGAGDIPENAWAEGNPNDETVGDMGSGFADVPPVEDASLVRVTLDETVVMGDGRQADSPASPVKGTEVPGDTPNTETRFTNTEEEKPRSEEKVDPPTKARETEIFAADHEQGEENGTTGNFQGRDSS